MNGKRKPAVKPLPILTAVDEMYWRAKIVSEFLEGYVEQLSEHANEAVRRMVDAIAVYEASRDFKPVVARVFPDTERKP